MSDPLAITLGLALTFLAYREVCHHVQRREWRAERREMLAAMHGQPILASASNFPFPSVPNLPPEVQQFQEAAEEAAARRARRERAEEVEQEHRARLMADSEATFSRLMSPLKERVDATLVPEEAEPVI